MSRRPPASGFTLIELSLVLVLFALLAGMAMPSLSASMSAARVDSVLARLTADIFLARSLAARDARPLLLRFAPASGCAATYEIATDSGEVLRRVTVGAGDAGVCLSSNVSRAMRIDARGVLTGSPRTVRAAAGRVSDSVTISIVGRVLRWQ
jgi:prepilin-type N-terminal cleavage/methylation domain-containing protein